MFAKRSARAMALLLALPSAAFALGLGDIHLHSPLNAPLDADIELVDVAADEVNTVQVQLASRDTFARYGLDWPTYLNSIKVTTARGSDGRQTIRLRSTDPITEPFVTLLVDVSWSRGHLVREYTMLLDPPVYAPGESAVASAPVVAPATGYAARALGDSGYFGIRRYPYSVDQTKNALSLRHISGTGVALHAIPLAEQRRRQLRGAQRRRGVGHHDVRDLRRAAEGARGQASPSKQMHRRMSDYVVAGLQLTPVERHLPSSSATRSWPRSAPRAPRISATAAAAFSRRGAGTCAVVAGAATSPDSRGRHRVGAKLKPVLVLGAVQPRRQRPAPAIRTASSTPHERGHLTFTVSNAGPGADERPRQLQAGDHHHRHHLPQRCRR